MALPDLITTDYATAQLLAGGRALDAAQVAALASKVAEASAAVRRWCGDRDFTRQTYDEVYRPSLGGTVDLRQIPVNKVLRVAGGRTAGITVANSSPSTNLRAAVGFTSTGDEATGITWTGLALYRTAAGVDVETDVTYAANPTLGQLAAAINALGNGWSATVPSNLASWPSSDLAGGDTAQDASGTGAELQVYAEAVGGCRVDRRTGELSVGIGGGSQGADSPRWGPYQDPADAGPVGSRVRVLYDAGFDAVPGPVQQATALYVNVLLNDLSKDLKLSSESVGSYSYVINTAFARPIPPEVVALLAPYRIIRI